MASALVHLDGTSMAGIGEDRWKIPQIYVNLQTCLTTYISVGLENFQGIRSVLNHKQNNPRRL